MRRLTDLLRRAFSGDGAGAILARGASGAMAVKIGAAAAGFLGHLVLANLLELRSFGDYIYVLGWVNVLAQFTTLGLTTAALRFIPTYRATESWGTVRGFLRRSTQITLVTSLAAGLGLLAAAWIGPGAMRDELAFTFIVGAIVLVLLSLLRLVSAQVQAARWILRAMAPAFVIRPLAIAAAVASLYAIIGPGLSGTQAMLGNLAATALVLVLLFGFRRSSMPHESRRVKPEFDTRHWLRVTSAFVLLSGFVYLLSRIDILMLGALTSTEEAGRYAIAAEIAALVIFGLYAVNAIVSPMISELHASGDRAKLERVLGLGALGSAVIGVLSMVALLVLGRWMLGLFGTEFEVVYTALLILAAGKLFPALIGLAGPLMTMTGHHRQAAMFATFAVVVNVALNALLIPLLGTTGAAVATASTLVAWNLLRLVYVLKRLRLNPTILALRREQAREEQ